MGKGVAKAVENIIKVIAPALIGMDPAAQQAIDDKMVQARRTASHHTTPHRAAPHRTWHGAPRGPRPAPSLPPRRAGARRQQERVGLVEVQARSQRHPRGLDGRLQGRCAHPTPSCHGPAPQLHPTAPQLHPSCTPAAPRAPRPSASLTLTLNTSPSPNPNPDPDPDPDPNPIPNPNPNS